jgi:hypothetical protein
MTWAQLLKWVFYINAEPCRARGGAVKVAALAHPCDRGISTSMHVIASIEDPVFIDKLLTYLDEKHRKQLLNGHRLQGKGLIFFLFSYCGWRI